MRVPNAGQDLIERRIVREGKALAEAMLANYVDPPDYSLAGLFRSAAESLSSLAHHLRGLAVRP
ncbi:hypothetical protein [uncultured Devosia sp.]|uniref:hypothetical protein n=1 Tax=uncultured Devosia sp. TaxID=211434 RepID=UPI002605ADB8|nr:hypothetical protein [uncultured Devosia sp.]